ncbi:MAG: tetratricopeptide repeat protein [Fidelibacterota bacterium]|nr:MAG: tetratricopeptide repeat protein [Candidatus Neomarinimicrobiota bacterium]
MTPLIAQESVDTTAVPSESSLLEQVYEHRISLMQDSLFLTQEKLDAANFMVHQLDDQVKTLADSLASTQAQIQQLADSLSNLFILYDRAISENRQNQARVNALGDSLIQSFQRERDLQVLSDSLTIILARTQTHLATTSGAQRAYSDTVASLRGILEDLRADLVASEDRVTAMYEQLGTAAVSTGGSRVDSSTDEKLIEYLHQVADYQQETSGLAKLFQSKGASEEIISYKQGEYTRYLAGVAMQGHTPEAINFLASTYLEQDDDIRGTLAYLKTLFIYPDSEPGRQAMTQLETLVEDEEELSRLYYEIALNPDSLSVGEEEFYRYLNYLNHIRLLPNATARDWFIQEARQFLAVYPGILQADQVLMWIAQAYQVQEQYHSAILSYLKLRALYPVSQYIPDATFAMAEITANDIEDYAVGAERYGRFCEEFPGHKKAPSALLAQASIYENELKNYQLAGVLYRQLADAYPDNALAPIALFQYAELLRARLGSSTGAMAVYEEVLTKYGAEPEAGIPALEGLASISRNLRQFDAAVVYYLDIYQRYPDQQERSVDAILEAAEIYESDLKNLDAAIHTLHIVLDNYPDYPGIKSVQRRVQKLQKKRG